MRFLSACRALLVDFSRGNSLKSFFFFYRHHLSAQGALSRYFFTYLMSRSAHRHGGYVGPGAFFSDEPCLPHGLKGIFISRYARIGARCRIYQNVTIGEVHGAAPTIGDDCLIGAGAVLIGKITIGDRVRIGAGCTVAHDVPSDTTVISAPARLIPHFRKERSECALL